MTGHDDTGADGTVDLRFLSRGITPQDAAAVTAVLTAVIEQSAPPAAADPATSAWVRSSGSLRRPFEQGPGRWVRSGR